MYIHVYIFNTRANNFLYAPHTRTRAIRTGFNYNTHLCYSVFALKANIAYNYWNRCSRRVGDSPHQSQS